MLKRMGLAERLRLIIKPLSYMTLLDTKLFVMALFKKTFVH